MGNWIYIPETALFQLQSLPRHIKVKVNMKVIGWWAMIWIWTTAISCTPRLHTEVVSTSFPSEHPADGPRFTAQSVLSAGTFLTKLISWGLLWLKLPCLELPWLNPYSWIVQILPYLLPPLSLKQLHFWGRQLVVLWKWLASPPSEQQCTLSSNTEQWKPLTHTPARHLWGSWSPGTGYPEELWMAHSWKCSRPLWMGLWATWASGQCPCPWQRLAL